MKNIVTEQEFVRLVLIMALIKYALNRINLASFISKRKMRIELCRKI
jgi:hypothetical protein